MKSNYIEHLAWFQHTVEPNIIKRHEEYTRCHHAALKRPLVSYDSMANYKEQLNSSTSLKFVDLDLPDQLSTSRKRKRLKEDLFMSNNELEIVKTSSPLPLSPLVSPVPTILEEHTLFNDALATDLSTAVSKNNRYKIFSCKKTPSEYVPPPTRSMSDLTVYYDAEDDWVDNDDIVEFEEISMSHLTGPVPPEAATLVNRREEISTLMAATFNIMHFLPNQYEAIDAALNGFDLFVVLPKGAIRNICYILPVMYHHPRLTTVVIVPDSIYLMQQDDHNIHNHKIPTLFVTKSKISYKKNWIPANEVDSCYMKKFGIVYMTFDMFAKCSLIINELHQENLLARIIIDEAQCISQWGDDFIFGFLRITENLKSTYPTVPITALTAVSYERVQLDIMHKLSIQNTCKIYKRSIFL